MKKKNFKEFLQNGIMQAMTDLSTFNDYSEKRHGEVKIGNRINGTTTGGYFIKDGVICENERVCI